MIVLIFILGTIFGSFLNAALYRLHPVKASPDGVTGKGGEKLSLFFGRSICPKCGHKLSWYDLIPVLSFMFLQGKCRYCREKISPRYLIVELLTGLVWAAYFFFNPGIIYTPLLALLTLTILTILIFIAFYDLEHFLILDIAVLFGSLLALIRAFLLGELRLAGMAAAGLVLLFLGLYYLSRKTWLGLGDVKLAVLLGLFNGPAVFAALLLASWLGALIGIFLIAFKGANLKTRLPFGTFLAFSAIIIETIEPILSTQFEIFF